MRVLKVLVAEDHALMREAIRSALSGSPDIGVVGEAQTGPQVLPLVRSTDPDLVLLDLRLPGMDGLRCLDLIRERFPKIKVVILSAVTDPDEVRRAIKRGATSYVFKHVNPADLPSILRQAAEGTVIHALHAVADDHTAAVDAGLSEKELVVLKAVARGLSNTQIAKELWVTEQTVKFHLTNVYRKLGVANRTEAARYAYEHGVVDQTLFERV